MSIVTTDRKAGPFLGDGVTTEFPFEFKVYDKAHLKVILTSSAGVESELMLGTDYTVSLSANQDNNPGGRVTLSAAPASGEKLTIITDQPATQEAVLNNMGGFFPKTIEKRLDWLTILVQQLSERLGRTFQGATSDSAPNFELGTAAQRAGKYVKFDDNGDVELSAEITGQSLTQTVFDSFVPTVGNAAKEAFFAAIAGVGAVEQALYKLIHPRTAAEISAGVTPVDYRYPEGNARRYGAVGDGIADDTTALSNWWAVGKQGVEIFLPAGTYLTSSALTHTAAMYVRGESEARIKATAAMTSVMGLNFDGGTSFWGYGSHIRGLILDGNGNAAYGLDLRNVISATFDDIRVTNVTVAGMRWGWTQLCKFEKFTCSNNVEAFTTTPVNGILAVQADGRGSSANIVIDPCIEHVSGAGIKLEECINTLFLNGTSEGNDIGIDLGTTNGNDVIGNIVVGMDLEVNKTTDIMLRPTAKANHFIGLQAGFDSPEVMSVGGKYNTFVGGMTGGFNFDANSDYNIINGTRLYGAGRTITDAGSFNQWTGVINVSDAVIVSDKSGLRHRQNFSMEGAGPVKINCAVCSLAVITAFGSALTIDEPLNPQDGHELDIVIVNASGGELTVTWDPIFRINSWTNPATGSNRAARFRYDANYGHWWAVSVSGADEPN